MKEKVLFVVHVEEMFRPFFGEGFEEEIQEAVYNGYDRVIFLESNLDIEGTIWEIDNAGHAERWEWAWGYEPEAFYQDSPELLDCFYNDENFESPIIDAWLSMHEWTEIPWELYNNPQTVTRLKRSDVWIAGGCDSECLADFRCVLQHMGIPYNETGITY